MTMRACLIGHPVAHSRSPAIHGFWLRTLGIDGSYELEDLGAAELPAFMARLRAGDYLGCNVTVPHKEAVLPLLDRLDETAEAVGAVNTIWREGVTLVGGNTDVYGFLTNLDEGAPGWDGNGRLALVLGAGGAARAACYGLVERGFNVALVNRTVERAKGLAGDLGPSVTAHTEGETAELLSACDLLVNTTSLGMVGKAALSIDLAPLKSEAVVNDIVYVPLETDLLKGAAARGLKTVGGLGMLLHQAVAGFERWFGVKPVVTSELRALIEADVREGQVLK